MSDSIAFWKVNDGRDEDLYHTTRDEALEDYVDYLAAIDLTPPDKVTLVGYARMEPSLRPKQVVEYVLEGWDEEVGAEDVYTAPTAAMLEAAKTFLQAVRAEYTPWACKDVVREEVDLREWLAESHRG